VKILPERKERRYEASLTYETIKFDELTNVSKKQSNFFQASFDHVQDPEGLEKEKEKYFARLRGGD